MNLHDTIRRELWHAYNWRETIERTGALCTAEQVVESGVAEIERAIAEIERLQPTTGSQVRSRA